MPKISADSVPEHRARMLEALIDGTEALLQERADITAGAVASRAGIARNSIYRYVDSIDDLIEAAMGRSFPRWSGEVREAMLAQASAEDKVAAYVRVNLELATDGSHAWHHALSRATLAASARSRMTTMHETLTDLLTGAIESLLDPDDARGEVVALEQTLLVRAIQALVDTCIRRIDAGDDSGKVIEFAERKTRALISSPGPSDD